MGFAFLKDRLTRLSLPEPANVPAHRRPQPAEEVKQFAGHQLFCSQVRPLLGPSLDVPAHRWAQAAEEAEHEDFNPFPVRPLTLRGGPKHRKRVAPSEFVLRELSETVQVLESEKIAGSDAAVPDKVWLCMTARAQELQRWTTGGNEALVACFEPLNFSLSPYFPPSFFILPFDLDWEKKRSTAGRDRARQSACKLVLRHEVNFRVNFYFLVSSSFYSLLGSFAKEGEVVRL